MTTPAPQSPRWPAWMGLVLGAVAWALHHQIGSNVTYADCKIGLIAAVGAGVPALGLATLGTLISLRAWRRAGGAPHESQEAPARFIAALSVGAGALFVLTILVQLGAGLVVPACAR
ncbi:hypothetical protein ACO2Q0_14350 [Phenylobacterium sp. VNQ135]|uniref:hypothetical protein n=1 Tax=Phenylobacterium sp. VNQ135 TaxID=3400922 RepID=UPI003BFF8792